MVIVKTTFDENVTKEINKEQFRKLNKFMIIVVFIFGLLGIVFIVNKDLPTGIFLLAFAILYFPLVKFITNAVTKRVNKTMSVMSSMTEETYTFDENGLSIEQVKGSEYIATVKTNYSYLYQVVENDHHFLLYISKIQMHVVPKDKIVEGSVIELREIFNNNLSDKFKTKLKKAK